MINIAQEPGWLIPRGRRILRPILMPRLKLIYWRIIESQVLDIRAADHFYASRSPF